VPADVRRGGIARGARRSPRRRRASPPGGGSGAWSGREPGRALPTLLSGFYSLYFIQDERFLLPALPLLLVLASLPLTAVALRPTRAGAGALLLGAALAGSKEFAAVVPDTAGWSSRASATDSREPVARRYT
jgi:hypothetical protein